ncbi:DUF397 domain-containing protein [Streptomyces werraensis]|uniref:DUF397 domain-containing protein n=1 Tax=Streptomyces werraensis TaxID=68284 RepID=UPI0038059BE0
MKSSYSENSACVEAKLSTELLVRDSKEHEFGTLTFSPNAWQHFVTTLREKTFSS